MLNIDKKLLACEPFNLAIAENATVLALGAELKSSICLIHNNTVYLGKTGQGLLDADSYRDYVKRAEIFLKAVNNKPDLVVCDLHPGYSSTRFAQSLGLQNLQIQHHYAHIVSCMIENDLSGPVLGIAADGTGYGDDGAIWGCEILKCDLSGYQRMGHLKYFRLFGGDTASVQTWRPAAGVMAETFGKDFKLKGIDSQSLEIAKKRLLSDTDLSATSSLGRLFDAVSFLLGICEENKTEAQAAIALETAASKADKPKPLEFELKETEDGTIEIDYRPLIKDIVRFRDSGADINSLAAGFHKTIAKMLIECVRIACQKTGIDIINLSGGCFLNKILSEYIVEMAEQYNLSVYTHKIVGPGDGCIAFGQACVGVNKIYPE